MSAVAPSALRYYERCDLIAEGVKIGGRRHYPTAVLHRLSAIKVCQKLGFSLTEIAELLNGNLAHDRGWREAALARRDEVEREITQLQRLLELIDRALDCDCHALCECPHVGPGGHIADTVPADDADDGSRAFGRRQQRV
jgi:MerR family transcriptional regulator, redox-sensitive transcriptional activator SoxR